MTAHWSEPWGAWHRFALTTARSSPSKPIRLAHRPWHSPAVKMPAWQRATQEMWAATEAVPSIHSDEGWQPISVALKASWRLRYRAPGVRAKRGSRRPNTPSSRRQSWMALPVAYSQNLIPPPCRSGTIEGLDCPHKSC